MISSYTIICFLYLLALTNSTDKPPRPPHCYFMANPGPCDSVIKMYAYDPSIDSCMEFIYTGCGGNPNRFETEKECQTVCNVDVFIEEREISLPPGKKKFNIEFIKPQQRQSDKKETCVIANPI